ncbi:MAG: hypothetical protein AAF492_20165, partial [Verrucomicrobiota bacterium]
MSEKETIEYPELPEDLKNGFNGKAFKYFGAGAIMASVTIGSGETLFASQAGAIFGYALMWCFVGGAIMKGVQVYTAARYITLTGEHPMTHWGRMPGPRNWVPWTIGILSLLCFPFWLAGLPMMIGQTINWIFGIDVQTLGMTAGDMKQALSQLAAGSPEHSALLEKKDALLTKTRLWATLFVFIAVTITALQTYKLLERCQMIIVGLLLVSMLAACIAAQPEWLSAIAGLVPSVPQYPEWIHLEYPSLAEDAEWVRVAICLGAIGGGTYDYIGYIGCLREKAWGAIGLKREHKDDARKPEELPIDPEPENIRRGKLWLLPAR